MYWNLTILKHTVVSTPEGTFLRTTIVIVVDRMKRVVAMLER
jgi:hypothetical protein